MASPQKLETPRKSARKCAQMCANSGIKKLFAFIRVHSRTENKNGPPKRAIFAACRRKGA